VGVAPGIEVAATVELAAGVAVFVAAGVSVAVAVGSVVGVADAGSVGVRVGVDAAAITWCGDSEIPLKYGATALRTVIAPRVRTRNTATNIIRANVTETSWPSRTS
jgi:hypothetical protein